ncbi:DUF4440 domain-containing protein [Pseudomonas gingeri]|uniref:DUF4440 domain-containing protein n=1 Tax=Pseudomonas gingeri TaxID=117681 RepID=UPI0015A064A1|nr:DUF4440 domain-containing protein [Pseudomonas gingeri]NWA23479.1 DUF4440 domain-containing protein [Pseudomonas gingeri]NWD75559.1 DUF4440 domain-containing protein [Pseudomonas gingeri]
MSDKALYLNEVIEAHKVIEQWFAGALANDALAPLLARFSEAFSMVTPGGRQLDKPGLAELFAGAGGRRPGCTITLGELEVFALHEAGAIVRYREWQADDSGTHTDRLSTAVFEKQADGRVLWRHLHETFCGA